MDKTVHLTPNRVNILRGEKVNSYPINRITRSSIRRLRDIMHNFLEIKLENLSTGEIWLVYPKKEEDMQKIVDANEKLVKELKNVELLRE